MTAPSALVLSGGGSLGATQVGMMAGLFATGLRPDFIVGVSAGALNGAFLAPLCPQTQPSYDYSAGARLIARARESTRQWIDARGLEKCEFPQQLTVHIH